MTLYLRISHFFDRTTQKTYFGCITCLLVITLTIFFQLSFCWLVRCHFFLHPEYSFLWLLSFLPFPSRALGSHQQISLLPRTPTPAVLSTSYFPCSEDPPQSWLPDHLSEDQHYLYPPLFTNTLDGLLPAGRMMPKYISHCDMLWTHSRFKWFSHHSLYTARCYAMNYKPFWTKMSLWVFPFLLVLFFFWSEDFFSQTKANLSFSLTQSL